jgi:hypothetical protein
VIVLDQMPADLLTMTSRRVKNERDRLLVEVKDPGAGTQAIAFGQGFQHTIDGFFIGVETGKDARVTTAKSPATFQTTIKWGAMWPVILN